MNFFNLIHRSIVDAQFYVEVLSAKRGFVATFFIKQIILMAVIAAAVQVFYLTDSKRGIVDSVVSTFSGMEIVQGILNSRREVPYILPTNTVASILEKIIGIPLFLGNTADSLFIVDTNFAIDYPIQVPAFVMKSDRLDLYLNSKTTITAPYNKLFPSADSIVFTKPFINEYIRKHALFLFVQMFMSNLFMTTLLLTFSVVFLSLAAYLFRIDKSRSLKQHARVAFFAVSPITVGSIIVSLSGVKISWIWNPLIFISTIVMFRAMLATGSDIKSTAGENE